MQRTPTVALEESKETYVGDRARPRPAFHLCLRSGPEAANLDGNLLIPQAPAHSVILPIPAPFGFR